MTDELTALKAQLAERDAEIGRLRTALCSAPSMMELNFAEQYIAWRNTALASDAGASILARLKAAEEEIAAAWQALGTTKEECADDPDTAMLCQSISVSLQYEKDSRTHEREHLEAQLAARDAEIGRLRAALRMAKINPGVCTATPDGQLYEWAILHNASIESVLAPVAEEVKK